MLILEGEDAVRFRENENKPLSPEVIQLFKDAKEMFKRIRWD